MALTQHSGLAPSPWVQRWSALVAADARVLDVACGSGRHVHWVAARGARVTALDRDAQAVAPLRALPGTPVEVVVADIENAPWPLAGRRFDAVLVTNYLWRPLRAAELAAVAPGGWLIHETFADGQQAIGRPSRPEFLLQPGELLAWLQPAPGAAPAWRVVAFEDAFFTAPDRFMQRIVGQRLAAG